MRPFLFFFSDPLPFRSFQRTLEFPCQAVHRRTATLPRALGLEALVADAAPPRRNDSADCTKIASLGMVLVESADDVGRHPDERAQRGCGLDAVLAAIPRRAEHDRHLLEVVHEELSGVFAKIRGFPGSSECVAGK